MSTENSAAAVVTPLSEDEAVEALKGPVQEVDTGTSQAAGDDAGVQVGGASHDDILHDDDDEGQDERTAKVDAELEAAADEAERELIRERRRDERKARRQRQRDKTGELERTVRTLAEQNQQMGQQLLELRDQSVGSQMAQVDQAIQQADAAAARFKAIIAEATTKADGATVAEATESMILARERAGQLRAYKQNATRLQNAPKPLNPLMVSQAKAFMDKHKWYSGPQSKDSDSKVLSVVDAALTAEGWDPTTPLYWSELEKRGRTYLPHRFSSPSGGSPRYNSTMQSTAAPKSPVAGAGSGSPSTSGARAVTLSADRVQALKDAGMWEDPVRRAKMVKIYQARDAADAAERR